ncbi:MAG: iron-sulfur cluster repair di-iron protein [Chitinophagaceae bacterium]|nr:iron-sulfur cluster repair di-iron protein [Chitinophagaceae bacterium]MBP7315807.1 iron-sulfur cluster repair di-iron protein [Chitinophagaceae bacterium]
MNVLASKTLAQIVTNNYKAASIFEKHHLDFCCKGKRTLEQACSESDIKIEEVIEQLEKAGDTNDLKTNYNELSLAQLSEHIVSTHHNYVKNEMPALHGYLQKVASKHGDRHPEMNKVFQIFVAVKEEMEFHMQKEEMVLFPRIKDIENQIQEGKKVVINSSYLQSPINMMEQEHDHAGSMLAEIRNLTNNYTPPADACTTYQLSFASLQAFELDLHHHVHLENNILFPKALKMFGETNKILLN